MRQSGSPLHPRRGWEGMRMRERARQLRRQGQQWGVRASIVLVQTGSMQREDILI
jgi:hypothetical protein